MNNIFVIAKNTFKEAIRDRILYAIVGFAVMFILLDLFMARLALGNPVMIKSFGLAGIYVFGLITTIFLGSSMIHKEIERRTLYFVLSKPVSRSDVVIGKFIGLFLAVAATVALMAVVYFGVVIYSAQTLDYPGLTAIFFELLEMGILAAILIFFSSLAAPMTATLLATVVVFMGHLLNSVLENARTIGGAIYNLSLAIYYLLPNLEKFNLRNLAVHEITPSPVSVLAAISYAALYSAALILASAIIFQKREL